MRLLQNAFPKLGSTLNLSLNDPNEDTTYG